MTEQMKALAEMQRQFGKTGFTDNHENYRRVGFRAPGGTLSAIGDTWAEAIDNLAAKVDHAKAA